VTGFATYGALARIGRDTEDVADLSDRTARAFLLGGPLSA